MVASVCGSGAFMGSCWCSIKFLRSGCECKVKYEICSMKNYCHVFGLFLASVVPSEVDGRISAT